MRKCQVFAFAVIMVLIFSCNKQIIIVPGEGLDDWSYTTHSGDATPDYATVFNQNEVGRLDIVISTSDWTIMQEDLSSLFGPGSGLLNTKPVYVPCQVYFKGKQWYDVGIRYKGNSSLRSSYQSGNGKLPFRLEFDHFEDENPAIYNQRFYGFKELSMGNNFTDNSLIHEKVATDTYSDFGVPVSKSAFYRVYVDYGDGPIYFGLYTMVEVVFDTMLDRVFGSSSGNCYKPDQDGAHLNDLTTVNSTYFPNKTNELASLDDVVALVTALVSDLRNSDPLQWRSNLDLIFDTEGFLKWMAANTTMQNWDTYGKMTHNYYLYNNPTSGKLTWIPWDNNETFTDGHPNGPGGGVLDFDFSNMLNDAPGSNGIDTWPLIRYLYDDPVYRNMYDNYIDEFIHGAFEPSLMVTRFTNAHNLIEPYVTGTDGEIAGYTFLSNPAAFTQSLSELTTFVNERFTEADNYLP